MTAPSCCKLALLTVRSTVSRGFAGKSPRAAWAAWRLTASNSPPAQSVNVCSTGYCCVDPPGLLGSAEMA